MPGFGGQTPFLRSPGGLCRTAGHGCAARLIQKLPETAERLFPVLTERTGPPGQDHDRIFVRSRSRGLRQTALPSVRQRRAGPEVKAETDACLGPVHMLAARPGGGSVKLLAEEFIRDLRKKRGKPRTACVPHIGRKIVFAAGWGGHLGPPQAYQALASSLEHSSRISFWRSIFPAPSMGMASSRTKSEALGTQRLGMPR